MPLGTLELGSFEVSSDHCDEEEDAESANETTEIMPPLQLGLWFSENRDVLQERSFGNRAMKITKTKMIHSLIIGMGSKSSPTLCNK